MILDTETIETINEILPLAESFCLSVLQYLERTTSLREVPMTIQEQYDFGDDGKVNKSYTLIPSYLMFLKKYCTANIMAEFKDSRLLIQSLLDANILMLPFPELPFEQSFFWLLNSVLMVVEEYLQSEETLDFHSDKFSTIFVAWVKDLLTPNWNEVTVPLIGFKSSINQIDLIDGFKICAFSNHDKSKFFNSLQSITSFYSDSDFSLCTHYLSGSSKEDCNSHQLLTDYAEDIITALRLMQEGQIGARAAFFVQHPKRKNRQQHEASSMDIFNVAKPISLDKRYEFSGENIDLLRNIAKYIQKSRQSNDNKNLVIALRRFNFSYTRRLPEDRLIDWTISLESTLLANKRDELKYRLALRGSILLRNFRSPEVTSSIFKTLYDVRSGVVHNGMTISDFVKKDGKIKSIYTVSEFLRLTENVTREVLIEYIKAAFLKNLNVSSVNDKIDQYLLSVISSPKEIFTKFLHKIEGFAY